MSDIPSSDPDKITPDEVPDLNEAQFLKQQASDAKRTMFAALRDAKSAITRDIDPKELARRHPWIAVGSAAAAGFAAAAAVVPSSNGKHTEPHKSLLAKLVSTAIDLAQPLLMGILSSAMSKADAPTAAKAPDGPDKSDPTSLQI